MTCVWLNIASSTSAYVRERARRWPSTSSVPRSRAFVRIAWTPTNRVGTTMRAKPNSSLRCSVTARSYSTSRSCAKRRSLSSRSSFRGSQHLTQDVQRPIHRLLLVRHRHEIVRRPLEQESPCRTAPRHLPRDVLAREMQKAHLRDPAHAGHPVAVLVVQVMEPGQQARAHPVQMAAHVFV